MAGRHAIPCGSAPRTYGCRRRVGDVPVHAAIPCPSHPSVLRIASFVTYTPDAP